MIIYMIWQISFGPRKCNRNEDETYNVIRDFDKYFIFYEIEHFYLNNNLAVKLSPYKIKPSHKLYKICNND